VQDCRIISSLSRAISAVDDWPAVLALARAPELQYVFSNTTEVGIVADAESAKDDVPPRSFPAKLTRFLFERARAFDYDPARGLTVIPCELIENNGAKLRLFVRMIAERWELGDDFMKWIDAAVPFCNTLSIALCRAHRVTPTCSDLAVYSATTMPCSPAVSRTVSSPSRAVTNYASVSRGRRQTMASWWHPTSRPIASGRCTC
jgi:mannitol-1-phosphate/altronate dehydrogenase